MAEKAYVAANANGTTQQFLSVYTELAHVLRFHSLEASFLLAESEFVRIY